MNVLKVITFKVYIDAFCKPRCSSKFSILCPTRLEIWRSERGQSVISMTSVEGISNYPLLNKKSLALGRNISAYSLGTCPCEWPLLHRLTQINHSLIICDSSISKSTDAKIPNWVALLRPVIFPLDLTLQLSWNARDIKRQDQRTEGRSNINSFQNRLTLYWKIDMQTIRVIRHCPVRDSVKWIQPPFFEETGSAADFVTTGNRSLTTFKFWTQLTQLN